MQIPIGLAHIVVFFRLFKKFCMISKRNHLFVQYGCGLSQPDNWLNFDSTPSLFVARIPLSKHLAKLALKYTDINNSSTFSPPRALQIIRNIIETKAIYGDITKGLPIHLKSSSQVYASHVIEHLPFCSAKLALINTLKILEPGGCFRLVVPNLSFYINKYISSNQANAAISFCIETGMGTEVWPNIFSRMRGDSHHLMYDSKALQYLLDSIGFSSVREAKYGDSVFDFSAVENPDRWCYPENIGFECIA